MFLENGSKIVLGPGVRMLKDGAVAQDMEFWLRRKSREQDDKEAQERINIYLHKKKLDIIQANTSIQLPNHTKVSK